MSTSASSRSLPFNTPALGDARDHTLALLSAGSGPLQSVPFLAGARGHSKARVWTFMDLMRTDAWVVTQLNGGSGTLAVIAATATQAAFLRAVNDNATNDEGVSMQLSFDGGTTAQAPIIVATGVNSVFYARIRTNVVEAGSLLAGFMPIAVDPLSSASAINNNSFVGVYSPPANNDIQGIVRTGGTSTAATLEGTGANDTWYEIAVVIEQRGLVTVWFNDGTGWEKSTPALTNLPANTVAMTPTFAVCNGTSPGAAVALDIEEAFVATYATPV